MKKNGKIKLLSDLDKNKNKDVMTTSGIEVDKSKIETVLSE